MALASCFNVLQHEAQELATWLACHQDAALKQLKTLRNVLEVVQSTASATADDIQRHQTNIAMLAQKEQQYKLQLQTLEEKLTTVKYSPLVGCHACVNRYKLHVVHLHLSLTHLCFCSCAIKPSCRDKLNMMSSPSWFQRKSLDLHSSWIYHPI